MKYVNQIIIVAAIVTMSILLFGCGKAPSGTDSGDLRGGESLREVSSDDVKAPSEKDKASGGVMVSPDDTEAADAGVSDTKAGAAEALALKSCASLSGNVCNAGEECSGEWLNAADTFSCCSGGCSIPGGDDVLEIPGFDVGALDEDMGDMI